jgi:hypothetical protein
VLLPLTSLVQINIVISKSIKVSLLKKSDNKGSIFYKREHKLPIALYSIFTTENRDIFLSHSKNATVFFTKNNAIYLKTHKTYKTIIAPFYDYRKNSYNLLEVDYSHIEHVSSVKEYVKTPKGEICLLYDTSEFTPDRHKSKTGIYNFDKQKIIYEAENKNVYRISYPLANSVAIILRLSGDKSIIYIDIVNLLDGSKHKIPYPIKDYLRNLVKSQANDALSLIDVEEYRHFVANLVNELFTAHSLFSEKISISQVYYEDYKIDFSLDGVVFYKSFTVHIVVKYKIRGEEHSLEIHHALILYCSLEEGELSIMLKPHKTCHWTIKFKHITTNVPSQVLLRKKYNIEIYGSFANSCLYDVTDLFDDYVIIKNKIKRLNLSHDDKNNDSSKSEKLLNVWRLGNTNIYETSDGTSNRFLVRFRAEAFRELCKARGYVVQDATHEVKVLDLSRLCDVLIKNQYKLMFSTKRHIDATKYVININTRPQMISSRVSEVCEGLMHKHKIYFDNKNGNVYLFLSTIKYNPNTKVFSTCISMYRYKISDYNRQWVSILTLGPYTYTSQELPTNVLRSFIIGEIIKVGYNMLLYSDFLTNLVEETNKINNVFLSADNIKFKFEDSYIEITDIIYNRRIVFTDNAYDKSRISSRIKQDDKVVACLDHDDDAKMSYKPFVLSEMELVKSTPYYT